jgi:hypothetical protein
MFKHIEISTFSNVLISIFVFAWAFYFLFIILRAIAIIGLREYLSRVISRDFRVWEGFYNILFIIISLRFFEGITLILITFVFLGSALKGILPPQILLLHSFDDLNYGFAKNLVNSKIGIVASLSGMEKSIDIFRGIIRANWGFGTKAGSESNWRRMVDKYIELAEVIIMDLSYASKGLIEEMQMLSKKPKHIKRLIFVYRDQEAAKIGFESLPETLKGDIPAYSYGNSVALPNNCISEDLKKEISIKGKYLMPMWLKIALVSLVYIVFFYEVF